MDNLRKISLTSLGSRSQISLFGRRESGPIRAFVHSSTEDSEKLSVVQKWDSDSQDYPSGYASVHNAFMDIYDTRRDNLLRLIKKLNMSYSAFGSAVGYNGQYIGQLLNRTKRSSGDDVIVSDKVVTKILSKLKNRAPDLTREWFDKPPAERTEAPRVTPVIAPQMVEEMTADVPPDFFIDSWPNYTAEERLNILNLAATFLSKKVTPAK